MTIWHYDENLVTCLHVGEGKDTEGNKGTGNIKKERERERERSRRLGLRNVSPKACFTGPVHTRCAGPSQKAAGKKMGPCCQLECSHQKICSRIQCEEQTTGVPPSCSRFRPRSAGNRGGEKGKEREREERKRKGEKLLRREVKNTAFLSPCRASWTSVTFLNLLLDKPVQQVWEWGKGKEPRN